LFVCTREERRKRSYCRSFRYRYSFPRRLSYDRCSGEGRRRRFDTMTCYIIFYGRADRNDNYDENNISTVARVRYFGRTLAAAAAAAKGVCDPAEAHALDAGSRRGRCGGGSDGGDRRPRSMRITITVRARLRLLSPRVCRLRRG